MEKDEKFIFEETRPRTFVEASGEQKELLVQELDRWAFEIEKIGRLTIPFLRTLANCKEAIGQINRDPGLDITVSEFVGNSTKCQTFAVPSIHPGRFSFFALIEGKLAGHAHVRRETSEEPYIAWAHTMPEFSHRGLYSELLKHIAVYCRTNNVGRLSSGTFESDHARRTWKGLVRKGFAYETKTDSFEFKE